MAVSVVSVMIVVLFAAQRVQRVPVTAVAGQIVFQTQVAAHTGRQTAVVAPTFVRVKPLFGVVSQHRVHYKPAVPSPLELLPSSLDHPHFRRHPAAR